MICGRDSFAAGPGPGPRKSRNCGTCVVFPDPVGAVSTSRFDSASVARIFSRMAWIGRIGLLILLSQRFTVEESTATRRVHANHQTANFRPAQRRAAAEKTRARHRQANGESLQPDAGAAAAQAVH